MTTARRPCCGSSRPRARGRAITRGIAGIVALTVLTLLAAACGGGGGTSKSDYVKKVNDLCRQSASMRRTLVPASNATPQQLVDALKQAVAVDQQLQQRITALSPPSGDAATIRQLLSLMAQSDQVTLQLADAVRQQNTKTMQALYPRLSDLGSQTRDVANHYGLDACTQKV